MTVALRSLLPWSVFDDALRGFKKTVAHDLGFKCPTVVERWCKPPADVDGVGAVNPLQRLTQVVKSLQHADQPLRAGVIVRAFCSSVGYVALPVSDATLALTLKNVGEQITCDGRFATAAAAALSDNVLTREEIVIAHETAAQARDHYAAIANCLYRSIVEMDTATVIANAPPRIDGTTKKYLKLTSASRSVA